MEEEKLRYCLVFVFFAGVLLFGFLSLFYYYGNTPQRVKEKAKYKIEKSEQPIEKAEAEMFGEEYEAPEEPEKETPPMYAYVFIVKSSLAFGLFEVSRKI